jgi:hypothetical protein
MQGVIRMQMMRLGRGRRRRRRLMMGRHRGVMECEHFCTGRSELMFGTGRIQFRAQMQTAQALAVGHGGSGANGATGRLLTGFRRGNCDRDRRIAIGPDREAVSGRGPIALGIVVMIDHISFFGRRRRQSKRPTAFFADLLNVRVNICAMP